MKQNYSLLELNAVTITGIYLLIGTLWILLSDLAVSWIFNDPETLRAVQSVKGVVYVLISGLLILLLVNKFGDKIETDRKMTDMALSAASSATWSINIESAPELQPGLHYRLFGYTDPDRNYTMDDFFARLHPDDRQRVLNEYFATLDQGGPYRSTYRVIWPDGEVHWLQSYGTIQFDEMGEPTVMTGILTDVTEIKKLRKAYDIEKEIFEKIYDSIPVMLTIYDLEINQIQVNAEFEKILGWEREIVPEIDLMQACYPDPEIRKRAARLMQEADYGWHEIEVCDKDGNPHLQEWTNIRLSNDITVGIGLEVTELRRKEKELELITKRYYGAEQMAGIGHWQRDLRSGESEVSDGFRRIIEAGEQEDISFKTMQSIILKEDWDHFYAAIEEAMQSGSIDIHYRIRTPESKKLKHIHELARVEFDPDGIPVMISGTIQDITKRKEAENRIKEEKHLFQTTLQNLPIGVAVNDIGSGEATIMNNKFAEIYGWPANYLTDVDIFFEKVYPDKEYRDYMIDLVMADIASGDPERMNWKGISIVTSEGEERIINAKNIPVPEFNLMISTVMDVTDQVNAERALFESEEKYRLLFEQSPLPMWIYDRSTLRFKDVNQAAIRHYGYTNDEFMNMKITDIRPEQDVPELMKVVKEAGPVHKDSREWKHVKKNGEVIDVKVTGSSVMYGNSDHRLVLAIDITEQKAAEEKILSSFIEGENKERARLARELHDGLGQYLAAANMNLDSISDKVRDKVAEKTAQKFSTGLNYLKHAIQETTTMSHNLLPRVVDDYGLKVAVETLADQYRKSTELEINFVSNIDALDLDHDKELNLYRIAQESLSNAVKYSEATVINIQLIQDELDLILTIDDNGIGFDPKGTEFSQGLGLQTLKTRAGALGGEIEISSQPGKGTLIQIIIGI